VTAPTASGDGRRDFWARPGLEVVAGRLQIAGRDADMLARRHGTPLYVFDLSKVDEQSRRLHAALDAAGLRHRVLLAMKAQREPEVLGYVRSLGAPGTPESVGLDVCSPGELLHGLCHGWLPDEISYTGTNVSERDLDVILAYPVHLNLDLLSQVRRVGKRAAAGRTVGLRINPRAGAAWRGENASLYSSSRPSKFGIYPEQLDDAVALAARFDLTIDTIHFHVGDGYLDAALPAFAVAVERGAEVVSRARALGCPIACINVGGGLGVPMVPGERPLDLEAWAEALASRLAHLEATVIVEPGDFLVKEAAVLLGEVVTVEDRMGVTFVGLDMGWNLMNDHFIYDAPFEYVVCGRADALRDDRVTITGNINEGDDLWAEDYPFPEVQEGEIIACINVGGYNQAMQMPHCLRPPAPALYFEDRLARTSAAAAKDNRRTR
jgi:diaminopimelate decarboxylase